MIKDIQNKFTGEVFVDFDSEFQAKEAFSKMMGLEIGKNILFVKKIQAPNVDEEELGINEEAAHDEVFR